MKIILISIFLLLTCVTTFFQYRFILKNHVPADENGIVKKPPVIALVLVFLLGCGIFFWDLFFHHATELTAFRDMQVFIWVCGLGYVDYLKRIIPNKLVLAGLIYFLIYLILKIFMDKVPWKEAIVFALLGGVLCGGVLLFISLITKGSLGMGDVKMFTVLGLLYGIWDVYTMVLISIFIMAIVSVILLITKKANRKTKIQMAPFVVIGVLFEMIIGGSGYAA